MNKKTTLVLFILSAFLLTTAQVNAQMMWGDWSSPNNFNSGYNHMMNFGYGFGIFGWFFMLLWWAFIIIIVITLIRWFKREFGNKHSNRAEDILKERYARGEINKEEFEEKKKDIS